MHECTALHIAAITKCSRKYILGTVFGSQWWENDFSLGLMALVQGIDLETHWVGIKTLQWAISVLMGFSNQADERGVRGRRGKAYEWMSARGPEQTGVCRLELISLSLEETQRGKPPHFTLQRPLSDPWAKVGGGGQACSHNWREPHICRNTCHRPRTHTSTYAHCVTHTQTHIYTHRMLENISRYVVNDTVLAMKGERPCIFHAALSRKSHSVCDCPLSTPGSNWLWLFKQHRLLYCHFLQSSERKKKKKMSRSAKERNSAAYKKFMPISQIIYTVFQITPLPNMKTVIGTAERYATFVVVPNMREDRKKDASITVPPCPHIITSQQQHIAIWAVNKLSDSKDSGRQVARWDEEKQTDATPNGVK